MLDLTTNDQLLHGPILEILFIIVKVIITEEVGIQMWTSQTEGEQMVEREIIQKRGKKNKELGLYVWVDGIKKKRKRDNVLSRKEKSDGNPFH